jgi:PGF-pre-PGF domain-containing protein
VVEVGKVTAFAFSEAKSEFISEIALTAKQDIYNVKITVETLKGKPYSFMPDLADLPYKYVKISTSRLPDTNIDKAEIKFKVEVSWLKENDIDPATVALCRNVQNKWDVLDTAKTEADDTYVYYMGETPGFSYFTITGEEGSGYAKKEDKKIPSDLAAIIGSMPKSTKPPETTVAPIETPPPVAEAMSVKEEKKFGICGPSAIILLAVLPLVGNGLLRSRD